MKKIIKRIIKKTRVYKKIKDKREVKSLKEHIEKSKDLWSIYQKKEIDEKLKFLEKKINNKEYKGIVIYAEAVLWEPIQRPQHFLKELGEKNYLCLFLVNNKHNEIIIEEKYKNVYVVNGQEKIIPLLKDKEVIFLITYFLQYVYAQNFNKKVIWLDVLDRLDFFSSYNSYSKKIWEELIEKADLITYSARNLKEFISDRKDAILFPNACREEDFIIEKEIIPEDIKSIIKSNKKIIGYYGAIEEWFDFDIIEKLSKTNKYEIVLIGKDSIRKDYPNVHYLGLKPYKELKNYAKYFDVAIIPFIVNDLTNNVSPVKFFEYLALKLPILSSKIYEMTFYQTPILKFIDDSENLEETIEELLKYSKKTLEIESRKILKSNTWKGRINQIEPLLEKKMSKINKNKKNNKI